MDDPEDGHERRRNLLGAVGGWWSDQLSRVAKLVTVAGAVAATLSVAFTAGAGIQAVRTNLQGLPDSVRANSHTVREHEVEIRQLDRNVEEVERDLTRIDLRQDSIVRALSTWMNQTNSRLWEIRCWARVSAQVDNPSSCIREPGE